MLTVNLLVLKIPNFIRSVSPMQKICFMKHYQQKIMVKYVWTEKGISIHFLFHLMKLHLQLPQLLKQVNKCMICHKKYLRVLPQSYGCNLVFQTKKFVMSE